MFRRLRILFLLIVLAGTALGLWLERARLASWDDPVWVAVYPINGEGSAAIDDYIRGLEERDFEPIERYLAEQARPYGLSTERPVTIKLAPPVGAKPPPAPREGALARMAWSLQMRWWAWRNDTFDGPEEIRVFVVYHELREGRRLAHSVGLEKARLGVVNAFADARHRGSNRVVLAHELLHTLGAADHYDRRTGAPIHPDGFAEPDRVPRYPQQRAALMGAVIPLGPERWRMPRSLDETVVVPATAAEIGWAPPAPGD